MKRLFFILTLLGLETQAWAHEDPARLSTEPIGWLLPIVAYAIPGVLTIVLLNEFFGRVGIAARLFVAVFLPSVFWILLLFVILPTDLTLFQMLSGLFDFFFLGIGWLIWVPASAIIIVFGLLDKRRRVKGDMIDCYAEL